MAIDLGVLGTISTANALRLVDAYCGIYGYEEEIDGAPNPESKNDFTIRMIKRRGFHEMLKDWEGNAAGNTANKSARDAYDAAPILTD